MLDDAARQAAVRGERWRSGAWPRHVLVEAASIEHKLAIAMSRTTPTTRQQTAQTAVRNHLQDARDAIRHHSPRPSWLVDWWRGTSIEQAYRSLHAARVFLVETLAENEVQELVPTVQAGIASGLPGTDARRLAVEKLSGVQDPSVLCARVQAGLDLLYELSDEAHQRIRVFRNILLSAAALIAVFMFLFVLVVNRYPAAVPLCFAPDSTAGIGAEPGSGLRIVCPHGESGPGQQPVQPTGLDIAIIAGLGLLGGALASAISVRKLTGRSTPYGVPTALALLKVPTGALTAVSGVLLLGGGFVPGLSELDSQRQIVAYALVLGYAQQLVTRLIDDRANALLAAVPAKGRDSPAATPSVPETTKPVGPDGSDSRPPNPDQAARAA